MSSMKDTRAGSADRPRRGHGRDRDLSEYISDEPLTALAIAAAAGFILGGGASSRLGLAALAMVGKIALRGAATNFLVGLLVPNPDQDRRRQDGRRTDRTRSGPRSKPNVQNKPDDSRL
jgi:hypothetical protein